MISKSSVSFNTEQLFYHFKALNQLKTVAHVISTRNSLSNSDFNLSFHTGEEDLVLGNRNQLRQFLEAQTLTIPKQCHGIAVAQVSKDNSLQIPIDTDALVTNVPGLAIGVLSADCVPILFFDPIKQVIGAAHAGWKGTVADIAGATVRKMQSAYGSEAQNIIACIGPSISQPHFEVGEEVADQFRQLELTACITHEKGTKPRIDLWEANGLLLQRAGIAADNIHVAALCTYDHADKFYSARKEGFGTGRFGAFILLQ